MSRRSWVPSWRTSSSGVSGITYESPLNRLRPALPRRRPKRLPGLASALLRGMQAAACSVIFRRSRAAKPGQSGFCGHTMHILPLLSVLSLCLRVWLLATLRRWQHGVRRPSGGALPAGGLGAVGAVGRRVRLSMAWPASGPTTRQVSLKLEEPGGQGFAIGLSELRRAAKR